MNLRNYCWCVIHKLLYAVWRKYLANEFGKLSADAKSAQSFPSKLRNWKINSMRRCPFAPFKLIAASIGNQRNFERSLGKPHEHIIPFVNVHWIHYKKLKPFFFILISHPRTFGFALKCSIVTFVCDTLTHLQFHSFLLQISNWAYIIEVHWYQGGKNIKMEKNKLINIRNFPWICSGVLMKHFRSCRKKEKVVLFLPLFRILVLRPLSRSLRFLSSVCIGIKLKHASFGRSQDKSSHLFLKFRRFPDFDH